MSLITTKDNPEISVVIPCYNEEKNVEAIANAVIQQLSPLGLSFDIIFIDNDSSDNTVPLLREMCNKNPNIRLIVNTRNFGQMRSPTHAIYQARGKGVIGMCADFQDPPELLPKFIAAWKNGDDIVLGVRNVEQNAGMIKKGFRQLSYWAARNFSDYPIIPNATGFGLYDQKVVRATRELAEPEPFFRGMLVETGFRVKTISYSRPERAAGDSKNNFFTLLDFAMSSLAGSSKRLLRVPLYLGFFGALTSLIMIMGGLFSYLLDGPVAGWFIAAFVQAQLSLLFGFLGLVGDNLRIVSERTRKTPLVLERERVNFPSDC
jgi:glycosyltransferase involved in cell wall biosynthesis